MQLPRVEPGKRALVLGRNGSGKTACAAWLLSRSRQRWVVLNAKDDELLNKCGLRVNFNASEIREALQDAKSPRVLIAHPESVNQSELDAVLFELSESVKNVGFCCDELLYLHKGNSQAGPGLLGWLTRGRSRKQSFIGCTQRPAMISQFCYSEADYYGVYDLPLKKDRARVADFTRDTVARERANYRWGWYDTKHDTLTEFGPVPFDNLAARFRA